MPLIFESVDVVQSVTTATLALKKRNPGPLLVDAQAFWGEWDEDALSLLDAAHGDVPLRSLRTLYGEILQVPIRRYRADQTSLADFIDEWTVGDYLRRARAGETAAYLANVALSDLPSIAAHYRPPTLAGRNLLRWNEQVTAPEAFIGPAHTQYGILHVDGRGGAIWCTCLAGAKEWVVFPPTDADLLLPHRGVGESQLRRSFLDPWLERTWSLYSVEQLHPRRVIVRAGQALYLPPGWWHIARNTEMTFTINERTWSWGAVPSLLKSWWFDAKNRVLPGTRQPYVLP